LSTLLESSEPLTQLNFNLFTGAHLLLVGHQLHQLHFQQQLTLPSGDNISTSAAFAAANQQHRLASHMFPKR